MRELLLMLFASVAGLGLGFGLGVNTGERLERLRPRSRKARTE